MTFFIKACEKRIFLSRLDKLNSPAIKVRYRANSKPLISQLSHCHLPSVYWLIPCCHQNLGHFAQFKIKIFTDFLPRVEITIISTGCLPRNALILEIFKIKHIFFGC
jgi:hypothetical protein